METLRCLKPYVSIFVYRMLSVFSRRYPQYMALYATANNLSH